MIEARAYHGLQFTIAKNAEDRVCYILLPEGLQVDGIKSVEDASERYNCNIILITGMDWNRDMTPWPAPGVFKKEKPFEGHATDFLKLLLEDYAPGIENSLGLHNPERILVGISLSGLFAVWTLFKTDAFKAIASISGSLWYDGFAEWADKQPLVNTAVKVHLSLGDKEKNSKNSRMALVEEDTCKVAEMLKSNGSVVDFQIVSGTHFSPIVPRLELALESSLLHFQDE